MVSLVEIDKMVTLAAIDECHQRLIFNGLQQGYPPLLRAKFTSKTTQKDNFVTNVKNIYTAGVSFKTFTRLALQL